MPILRFLLGFVLLAAACGSPTESSTVDLDETFTLAPGDRARVDGVDLTVLFDQVASDSRCPVNVVCVWEGDAVVKATLSQPGQSSSTVELHTSAQSARKVTYGSLTVTLVGLAPEPREGTAISQGAYRATFVVSR